MRFACCKRIEVLDDAAERLALAVDEHWSRRLRIAAIQHDIVWNDRDANFERLAPMIGAAAGAGAGLVLLHRDVLHRVRRRRPGHRRAEGGPSSQFLAAQAREHGVWVGGSCPEVPPDAPADDQRPSNCFVLAGPDGTLHRYRKIHPFSYGGEEKHFRAGTELVTVDVEGLRVSLFVCYDLRFADEFWQLARDTDVYLVPANWPDKRRLHWTRCCRRGRSRTRRTWSASTGSARAAGSTTCGDSRIVDPLGELLATAAGTESHAARRHLGRHRRRTRDHFRFLPDRR